MTNFKLDFDELAKIDGVPKDNLTFRINIDDLVIDWDDELGSGSFAQVFRAWYLHTEVAVKKMILPIEEQDKVLIKYFKREVVLLNLIKHPNIVQFLGWCYPEDSNYLLIVEEFIKGGTLQNFINKKAAKDLWGIKVLLCMDVAKAMLYLHKNKVVYRDLKCDNILIDDPVKPRLAKVVDFGFARVMEEQQRKGPPMTICGTDDWMAPEVILGMDYDEGSDIFSFGVVLLECILGTDNVKNKLARKPFNSFELDTDLARSLTPVSCPEELLELALLCCSYEPTARPDFNEIITILTNVHRHSHDSSHEGGLSDVSTDTSPVTSRLRVDLSHLSPEFDDLAHSARSAGGSRLSTGSRESGSHISAGSPGSGSRISGGSRESGGSRDSAASRESDKLLEFPPLEASLSPAATSPLSKSDSITIRRVDGQRRASFADDEAEDLRRRLSCQSNISLPSANTESPKLNLNFGGTSPKQVSFYDTRLDSSRDELTRSLNLSGYDSRDKREYIRVESLVDAFTVWNVRVGPGSTVADVCENLAKKIDSKYKFVELYQLNKRKRVSLFPEQFIDQIRARWGADQDYKFGLMYRATDGGNDFRASTTRKASFYKNVTMNKKDKETYSTKKTREKKKNVAMSVNFTMNPV